MISWIYSFSKITPEALLFEASIIFMLFCLYSAFWVLHKRKYGAATSTLPTGHVKTYLNDLIGNAELLREQLFGILASHEASVSTSPRASLPSATSEGTSQKSLEEIAFLKIKMEDQTRQIATLLFEKTSLEAASAGAAPASSDESAATIKTLNTRITDLEDKLLEYSVIEDDLVNLKRLQQENEQLRAAAEGMGNTPKPAPSPATPEPEAAQAAPPPAVKEAAPPPPPTHDADGLPENLASTIDEAVDLLSQMDQAPDAPIAAEAEPLLPPEETNLDNVQEDAELLAEFEKMLGG